MSEVKLDDNIYTPVSPIYRIPDIEIDPELLVSRAEEKFEQFQADRFDFLKRREEYYLGWDDYISPVRVGLYDNASNFHLPLTEVQCSAMHARLMQSIFFINPPFFVDPQEEVDLERIKKIERYMKYIIFRYTNYHKGIYNAVDDFCWDLTTDGMAIFSRGWDIIQRRHIGIEENQDFKDHAGMLDDLLRGDMDMEEFEEKSQLLRKEPFIEKQKVRTVFNGPTLIAKDITYVLFEGEVVDSTDLNMHETVIEVEYYTKDELLQFKHSDFMDEDVIDAMIERGPDIKGGTNASSRTSNLNFFKDRATGIRTQNNSGQKDQWELLKVYDNVSLDPKNKHSLLDRLVYHVHLPTRSLARWTFLDRISADGKLPLYMSHLYRRPRRSTGRGMVETQFALNEVLDILINQSIDAGMLANNPMFAYKGDSDFDPGEIRVEPGLGIKADDPNSDLRFFTFNVNPNWSVPVQQLVQSMASQLTSLGPLSTGQVGSRVGPTRSTSGVNALLAQTDIQLDVVLKRTAFCMGEVYEGLYTDCVQRMPKNLKLSILGNTGEIVKDENGIPQFYEISKEDLRTRVHFGLLANTTNMNREAQKENAMLMAKFLMQPAALKSGIVSPGNMYEIYKHILDTFGTLKIDRFITEPQQYSGAMPLGFELLSIMQGVMPHIVLNDPEHLQKIESIQMLLDSPKAQQEAEYGVVHPKAMQLLKAAQQKHQQFLDILNKPQEVGNVTGSNVSDTLGQQQFGSPEANQQGPEVASETNITAGPGPNTAGLKQGQGGGGAQTEGEA